MARKIKVVDPFPVGRADGSEVLLTSSELLQIRAVRIHAPDVRDIVSPVKTPGKDDPIPTERTFFEQASRICQKGRRIASVFVDAHDAICLGDEELAVACPIEM